MINNIYDFASNELINQKMNNNNKMVGRILHMWTSNMILKRVWVYRSMVCRLVVFYTSAYYSFLLFKGQVGRGLVRPLCNFPHTHLFVCITLTLNFCHHWHSNAGNMEKYKTTAEIIINDLCIQENWHMFKSNNWQMNYSRNIVIGLIANRLHMCDYYIQENRVCKDSRMDAFVPYRLEP